MGEHDVSLAAATAVAALATRFEFAKIKKQNLRKTKLFTKHLLCTFRYYKTAWKFWLLLFFWNFDLDSFLDGIMKMNGKLIAYVALFGLLCIGIKFDKVTGSIIDEG